MCSVVGYVGYRQSCSLVIQSLSRLEYRGYDSSGFACIDVRTHKLSCVKTVGGIVSLQAKLDEKQCDGFVGVGHTRWSTHGTSSEINAHPHTDCHQKIAVVHNGIIENHAVLKKELEALGHTFRSQTDSEVIAHLFEQILLEVYDYRLAAQLLVSRLQGAYAIVIMMEAFPEVLIAIRKNSPLCIGVGKNEFFIASDVLAFSGMIEKVIFMPEQTIAFVSKQQSEKASEIAIVFSDFFHNQIHPKVQPLDAVWLASEKDGYEHYMLKEIYEQKSAIYKTVSHYAQQQDSFFQELGISADVFKNVKSIKIIGCGTSWHAGRIAEFFFEEGAEIPTTAALASEFRYRKFFPSSASDTLYIAISQSGETADTLEAVRFLRSHNQHILALTNVASSTLARESDGLLLTYAGPEMAVASTKAFTTQVASLYWLAQRIALERGTSTQEQFKQAQEALLLAGELLENNLAEHKAMIFETLAPLYAKRSTFIFLGRHMSYPFALEAALKLKEIAYIFSQAYPAGELKHGPLALIDEQTPVCIFSHPDPVMYQKILSSAQEVKARKGHVLAFAFEGQKELQDLSDQVLVFPLMHHHLAIIMMTGVMQLFMYAVAHAKGCAIDRPRNLAKSVTVE